MQKLKNQLIVTWIKKLFLMTFVLTTIFLVGISCKNKSEIENNDLYNLDISIKYKKEINSFIIDSNGTAFVVIKAVNKSDKYYKMTFSKHEMNHIQKSLKEIDFSICDTIEENIMDGVQYALYIDNNTIKREIISGTCKQQKPLNKLVKFIVETYNKKQKEDIFRGLKLIVPPDLTENENTKSIQN